MTEYPCRMCLIQPCCDMERLDCELILNFMNKTADEMLKATANEIHKFRITTPVDIKTIVETLIRENKRYAYPVYIKAHWKELIPAYRHEKIRS